MLEADQKRKRFVYNISAYDRREEYFMAKKKQTDRQRLDYKQLWSTI